jgi:hypothetical protein
MKGQLLLRCSPRSVALLVILLTLASVFLSLTGHAWARPLPAADARLARAGSEASALNPTSGAISAVSGVTDTVGYVYLPSVVRSDQ